MKVNTSEVMRAVERIVVSMMSNPGREVASESKEGMEVYATRATSASTPAKKIVRITIDLEE